MCRRHAEQLAVELERGAVGTIDDIMEGRISIGDVIAGAVTGYVERVFGQSPWLRDLDQAARDAAAHGQARRERPRPPPGSPSGSRSPPRSGPPPRPPPRARPPDYEAIRARDVLGFEGTQVLSKEAIDDRRRQLAKVYHPDRPGGSTAMMQRVNAAADLLLERLARSGAKPAPDPTPKRP